MIIVWTRPGCGPCLAVKAALRSKGVEYVERSLADATGAQIDAWRAAGALSAPVVESPSGTFGGFEPAKVRALADARR